MPRKTKLQKVIEEAAEKPEVHTFQPYTWIRCNRGNMWRDDVKHGQRYLFMGWISNNPEFGDNAVLMDDRGVFTTSIKEEDFEVL
jgi:hypothetical protein